MKRIAILYVFLRLLVTSLPAQETPEEWLDAVQSAVDTQSYTRALSLLEQGKAMWPRDSRFPAFSGRLFKERELYGLALTEFRAASALAPLDRDLSLDIADILGYLGRNDESVLELEALLDQTLDETTRDSVIDDLSWMYYKTYRMSDGVALLEEALAERYDRRWVHTLGTLYSGLYDYERSRESYMASIEDALADNDRYFASIAHYNLAILEMGFYQYEQARKEADESLLLRNRSGGYLARGEIAFLAWDVEDALADYRTAESMDETPLSLMNTAILYQRIGWLDEALRLVGEIEDRADESWMYHFGLDTIQFAKDRSEILAAVWKGKAQVEGLSPRAGFVPRIQSWTQRLVWRARGLYHDRRYRGLARSISQELRAEGNFLDGAVNAAMANEGYRFSAVAAWQEAQAIEEELTPFASPWYWLEIGREESDRNTLVAAAEGFRESEASSRERALRELALMGDDQALGLLYAMNSGGLRQYGLALPLNIRAVGVDSPLLRRTVGKIRRLARRAGHHPSRFDKSASADLLFRETDGGLDWFLSGPLGRTLASGHYDRSFRNRDLTAFLGGILDDLYFMAVGFGSLPGGN